jgi:hypothetical protein
MPRVTDLCRGSLGWTLGGSADHAKGINSESTRAFEKGKSRFTIFPIPKYVHENRKLM